MKKHFLLFLMCCAAFVYANDDSFFEETDDETNATSFKSFSFEEPIFTEDDGNLPQGCEDCEDPEEKATFFLQSSANPSSCFFQGKGKPHGWYSHWTRYKASFGIENVFVRFPQRPAVSRSSTLPSYSYDNRNPTIITAYAYDNAVRYSLSGYYPPLGNIDAASWFDLTLRNLDPYRFTLTKQHIFQTANGNWAMDYVVHDYVQNLIIKTRAIVTRFNGYSLQCVEPNGTWDYFDYFLENITIKKNFD